MRRLLSAVVVATIIFSMLPVGVPAAAGANGGGPVTYLALGDSLAAGFQPNGVTGKGYVDYLWRSIRQHIPALTLRNVACPGETSGSLITGRKSGCHYAAGSQLNAAVNFLEAHRGKVAFITITIGANDLVNRCLADNGLFDEACAVEMRPRLRARVAHIVRALRAAAGHGVPIVGMKYYDPFLGFWGLVPGGRTLARASLEAFKVMNAGLATAYKNTGAAVADAAGKFRIRDFEHKVDVPGRGPLPVNVALACAWTWFCTPRFAGDPHPNRTGAQKVAEMFERKLRHRLPL
jgi:lysophospholipase L1-like esterase